MPVYRLTKDAIVEVPRTSYADRGVKERGNLQRQPKANISVVASDVLAISEEFGDWEDSKRRIDLLGIDRESNLVVRDDEGGHMELQTIHHELLSRAALADLHWKSAEPSFVRVSIGD